jgi:hypothetical protein
MPLRPTATEPRNRNLQSELSKSKQNCGTSIGYPGTDYWSLLEAKALFRLFELLPATGGKRADAGKASRPQVKFTPCWLRRGV